MNETQIEEKLSALGKKPKPSDYGFVPNEGFDSEGDYWALEEGEDQYHLACDIWNQKRVSLMAELGIDTKSEYALKLLFMAENGLGFEDFKNDI